MLSDGSPIPVMRAYSGRLKSPCRLASISVALSSPWLCSATVNSRCNRYRYCELRLWRRGKSNTKSILRHSIFFSLRPSFCFSQCSRLNLSVLYIDVKSQQCRSPAPRQPLSMLSTTSLWRSTTPPSVLLAQTLTMLGAGTRLCLLIASGPLLEPCLCRSS